MLNALCYTSQKGQYLNSRGLVINEIISGATICLQERVFWKGRWREIIVKYLKWIHSRNRNVEEEIIQSVVVHRIALALPVFVKLFKSLNFSELQFPIYTVGKYLFLQISWEDNKREHMLVMMCRGAEWV